MKSCTENKMAPVYRSWTPNIVSRCNLVPGAAKIITSTPEAPGSSMSNAPQTLSESSPYHRPVHEHTNLCASCSLK